MGIGRGERESVSIRYKKQVQAPYPLTGGKLVYSPGTAKHGVREEVVPLVRVLVRSTRRAFSALDRGHLVKIGKRNEKTELAFLSLLQADRHPFSPPLKAMFPSACLEAIVPWRALVADRPLRL